ncbi:TetR/AcrR family transcriptional regulator [Paenarthrobacter sp. YAF11_1]|uniref:TetR/AcrR family transcriptional regulator n=1 Tax=Paenarthrobacter sp. YAF11_1 TaxID=3233074 RepID=UPI003F98DD38
MGDPLKGEASVPVRREGRLSRGSLTREVIVEAALRILDEGPASGLTFSRLGKELGASPTAMYRHFSSREEIITAVADELDRMAFDGYSPAEDWMDSLRDLAYRAWHTYERHPSAATHSFYRTTQGPNEIRVVDAILEALDRAGWRGRDAVFQYQMYSNLVLGLSGRHAAMISATTEAGVAPGTFWKQEYHPIRPEDFPFVSGLHDELRVKDAFSIYQGQLEALLSAMRSAQPSLAAKPTMPQRPA